MLTEVCREVRNFFEIDSEQGIFKIQDGILLGTKYKYPINSYIAIERITRHSYGSLLNAGVYKVVDDKMTLQGDFEPQDEEWYGVIWLLSVPHDFLSLMEEIKTNVANTPQTNKTSESFGIYSVSYATDKNGAILSWNQVYASRLEKFRWQMFLDINI